MSFWSVACSHSKFSIFSMWVARWSRSFLTYAFWSSICIYISASFACLTICESLLSPSFSLLYRFRKSSRAFSHFYFMSLFSIYSCLICLSQSSRSSCQSLSSLCKLNIAWFWRWMSWSFAQIVSCIILLVRSSWVHFSRSFVISFLPSSFDYLNFCRSWHSWRF